MSLIQRATQRLGEGAAAAAAAGPPPMPAAVGASPGLVERAAAALPASPAARGAGQVALRQGQPIDIDLQRLARLGYVTPETRKARLAEELRLVKRRLMSHMPLFAPQDGLPGDPIANMLMMTSAKPGEGKSFMAVNLALSFCVDEKVPVILIDADAARPTITASLCLEPGPGLVEHLLDGADDLSRLFLHDSRLNLTVMRAGGRATEPSELIGGKAMIGFLQRLGYDYPDHIIIFDTPPVLATTEPLVLTQAIGQVLVVVEANRTPRGALQAALEMLAPCSNVKLVLNKMRGFNHGQQFGHYYYNKYN